MRKNSTLYQAFLDGAENSGGKAPAILYMNKLFSFSTVKRKIEELSSALYKNGIRKGDIVIVCLPNIPEALYCLYALNKLGAVFYPVHALYTPDQMRDSVKNTNAKMIFALDIYAGQYRDIAREFNAMLVSCSPVSGFSFIIRNVYKIKNRKRILKIKPEKERKDHAAIASYDSLINTGKETAAPVSGFDKDETTVLLNSGGTSGDPKVVELTDFSINALCINSCGILGTSNVVNKYMLSALPYFHGFGFAMGLHAVASHGGCVAMLPRFKRKDAVKYIKRKKINYLIGVPALYSALLSHPDFKGKNLSSLEVAFVGGDFVPQALIDSFNIRMKDGGSKCRLFEGYGLTETVTVCCLNTHAANRAGTVGRVIANAEIKTFETEEVKQFLESGFLGIPGAGELCVRGETLMKGYYKDKLSSLKTQIKDEYGHVWLKTGDFGFIDSDNFVHFKQRLKRIIKVSGISVFPSEIEQIASESEFVENVCAYEIPDKKRGNAVRLVVQTPLEDTAALKASLIDKLAAKLEKYAVPKEIIFIKKMPLTPMNKIDYAALKKIDII